MKLPRIPPKHLKDGCYARADALEAHLNAANSKLERLQAAANAVLAHFMPSFPDSRAVDDCLVGLAAAVVDVERPVHELSDGAHSDWLAGAQGLVDACVLKASPGAVEAAANIVGRLGQMAHCIEIGALVEEVKPGEGYQWTLKEVVTLLDDAIELLANQRTP